MIYVLIFLIVIILAILILVWLRKVQFDAVHRNFLDLVDHYGGKVFRGGFAIRPRFSGEINGSPISISISSEKRKKNQQRQFYISVFFKTPANLNFTIMSNQWLNLRVESKEGKRPAVEIVENQYRLEVSQKNILKKLDIPKIENILKRIHPIAYVLVSKRGLILERISTNLIKDTEFDKLKELIEGMGELSRLTVMDAR